MAFNGNEGEVFPLATAAEWTAHYRQTAKVGSTIAHFFGKNILNSILAQEGCMGIRFYYALDENNAKQIIAVGADANERDMYNGIIAERSFLCPPYCDDSNSPLKG